MLQYEKIDASEGIDINKTSASKKECMLCYYLYFKDIDYKFQPYLGNKCHDVLKTASKL